MSGVLDDLALASEMSLDDAWRRIVNSVTAIRSARERIARTTGKTIDPDEMDGCLLAVAPSVQDHRDRLGVDTGVVSVGELLVLGEAVRILARVQLEGPLDPAACEAAGLCRSTIQMLLDDVVTNADAAAPAAV